MVVETSVLNYLIQEIVEENFDFARETKSIICKSLNLESLSLQTFGLESCSVDPELVVPVTVGAAAYLVNGGIVSAIHYLASMLYLAPEKLQLILRANDEQMETLKDLLNLFLDGWNDLKLGATQLPIDGQIYVRGDNRA